ncbi:MAG: DUF5011 domain-containing protein [Bacteroidia bacterium]
MNFKHLNIGSKTNIKSLPSRYLICIMVFFASATVNAQLISVDAFDLSTFGKDHFVLESDCFQALYFNDRDVYRATVARTNFSEQIHFGFNCTEQYGAQNHYRFSTGLFDFGLALNAERWDTQIINENDRIKLAYSANTQSSITSSKDLLKVDSKEKGIRGHVLKTGSENELGYCIPTVAFLNSDIGISRVELNEIDNSSAMAKVAYSDFSENYATALQIGAKYKLVLHRSGNRVNKLRKSVWIDINHDGDFNDSMELVAFSGPDQKAVDTFYFTVPKASFIGVTTLRVGVGLGNKINIPCGPNKFGEFEDYAISITPDQEAPKVYFKINGKTHEGKATIQVEQCSQIKYPAVWANDNIDGLLGIDTILGKVLLNNIGEYTLEFKAIDSAKNEGVGLLNVRVFADTSAPDISIKGALLDTVQVFTSYLDLGVSMIDNCSDELKLLTTSKLNTNKVGTYTIKYSAIDNSNNVTTVEKQVCVVDTVRPVITALKGEDTLWLEVMEMYNEPGLVYSDNYYDQKDLEIVKRGQVNVDETGAYTLNYSVIDPSGNSSKGVSRIVKVIDTQKPVLTLIGTDTVEVNVFERFYDTGVKATDNSNKTLKVINSGSFIDSFGINGISNKIGFYNYTYTVFDQCGNSSSVTRVISVIDNKAPQIELRGKQTLVIKRNDDYVDPGVTVIDNYWSKRGVWYTVEDNINTKKIGAYYAKYCPFDSSQNVGECLLRYVLVNEPTHVTPTKQLEIDVYPNPASDFITIKGPASSELTIVDDKGSTIFEDVLFCGFQVLNTQNWAAGSYLINVKFEAEISYYKIQIVR